MSPLALSLYIDFTESIGFHNDRCLILQYIILGVLNGVVGCSMLGSWPVEDEVPSRARAPLVADATGGSGKGKAPHDPCRETTTVAKRQIETAVRLGLVQEYVLPQSHCSRIVFDGGEGHASAISELSVTFLTRSPVSLSSSSTLFLSFSSSLSCLNRRGVRLLAAIFLLLFLSVIYVDDVERRPFRVVFFLFYSWTLVVDIFNCSRKLEIHSLPAPSSIYEHCS